MRSGTISITVPGAGEELRQLTSWLRDEDELRGRVKANQALPSPGQMGAVIDSVAVVLTSGSAAVFCRSLFGWLGRRRDASKVLLKVKRSDGQEVELTCGSDDDAGKVLASLRDFLGPGE